MSEKWEYVVKGGKHKQKSQMSSKEIKQIKESNLNGNKYTRGIDDETDESISPELSKVPSKNKNKPKASAKGDGEIKLNQQIGKLNSENIRLLHKELLEKFPNQHTVILMDLALHLNLMIKPTEDSLKNINFDNIDFPYGLLLNDTKSALRTVFNGLNNVQLGNFLKSAMVQIVDDNEKGIKSVGLLMLLQVCLKMKPTALVSNRKSIFELMNMYREQTVKFKCLIWVLKQACINFNVACQIWLIYLLPFINQRCNTETVLTFGEEIMNCPSDIGGNDSVLLHTDFLPIVDLIFNQPTDTDNAGKKGKRKQMSFQLAPAHLQRLNVIYHKIKDQIFTSKAAGSFTDYFSSLFFRLSFKNKNAEFNKELLDCLDRCVISCPDSLKLLEHLYVDQPQQTKIFLDHFKSGKSPAAAIVMKQKVYKTMIDKIHSLSLASAQSSVSEPMKPSYHQNCESSSCLGTLFRVLFYTILLAVFAAIVLSYQFPQHYKEIAQKTKPYYESILTKAMPYYRYCHSRALEAVKVIQPYVASTGEKVKAKSLRIWTLLRPYVERVGAKMEEVSHYVYDKVEEVAPEVLDKVGQMYVSLETYAVDVYVKTSKYLSSDEVQTVAKSVSDKLSTVGAQVQSGYKAAVAYMLKVVGY